MTVADTGPRSASAVGSVRITSTHHVAVTFACPVDTIWQDMLGFADGSRFERYGFTVETLSEDPRAYRGGYRLRRQRGDDLDERLCFVTEQDDVAKRISVCACYLAESAMGTVVQATYSAVPSAQGSIYQIDCHATRDFAIDKDTPEAGLARMIESSIQENDQYMRSALESERARFEGTG